MLSQQDKAYLEVYNKTFVNGLIKQGCTPKKSKILQFPKIPKQLHPHFIRGYFDGDGSVFMGKSGYNKGKWGFSIASGSEDFLLTLKNLMDHESITTSIGSGKGCQILRPLKKSTKDFAKYLMLSPVFLDRKQKILQRYLSTACKNS